ncbi:MAG: hypothetical protein ACR2KT_16810, partial [Methylocella sp.]
HSAASDQRNPIAPSHRSHWSNSKRFFETDFAGRAEGVFFEMPKSMVAAKYSVQSRQLFDIEDSRIALSILRFESVD